MKNKVSKYYTVIFYFCSTFILFADPGTGTDDTIPLESTDLPAASINEYIYALALTGLILAFLKFKYFQQNKTVTIALTPLNSKKHP